MNTAGRPNDRGVTNPGLRVCEHGSSVMSLRPPTPYTAVDEFGPMQRAMARLGRNWQWFRDGGWQSLADEHDLHLAERARNAQRRAAWRRTNRGVQGKALAAFLVGAQRSGTNMLVRALAALPEVEIRSENDRKAFTRFKLRSDAELRRLIEDSRHRVVLLKPLCESHRVDELLDHLPTAEPRRAIWMYRSMEGRVRSALAKFGDVNLSVLRDYASGIGLDRWQVQRLSPANAEFIRSFDYGELSPASGAALFWYIRNSLFFDLRLDERDDAFLLDYERLLADPATWSTKLTTFLDVDWDPLMIRHLRKLGTGHKEPLDIHPRIRARCAELEERLAAALDAAR